MKYRLNEKGLTLVELLAGIVILAIISLCLWSIFHNSMNHNNREVSKNQLQQEANIIINTIQNLHTKHKITQLVVDENNSSFTIYYSDRNQNNIIKNSTFNKRNIKYEFCAFTDPDTNKKCVLSNKIFPESATEVSQYFGFKLKLSSTNNENINFEVQTIFSKLE